MRPSVFSTLALLLLASLAAPAISLRAQSTCGPPPSIFTSTQPNIFSEQQEQWLGEAMADYNERYNRHVKNPELNAYLKTIGARLLAVLPPTAIQFQFTLVESSEVNGFSLAGGHVYLTRKLVASARNEDEIAGVIAHEMGHILTHQFAIETTAGLHKLLGITQVGDRADIYAKFQRLVDAQQHQKHQADIDSDDKQDQADQVAVYATAAAGYRPQAYAEFWDRSFFVGGKTGSHLGDFFGSTTPSQRRLRSIRGIVAKLPTGCGTTIAMTATPPLRNGRRMSLKTRLPVPPPLRRTPLLPHPLHPPQALAPRPHCNLRRRCGSISNAFASAVMVNTFWPRMRARSSSCPAIPSRNCSESTANTPFQRSSPLTRKKSSSRPVGCMWSGGTSLNISWSPPTRSSRSKAAFRRSLRRTVAPSSASTLPKPSEPPTASASP